MSRKQPSRGSKDAAADSIAGMAHFDLMVKTKTKLENFVAKRREIESRSRVGKPGKASKHVVLL